MFRTSHLLKQNPLPQPISILGTTFSFMAPGDLLSYMDLVFGLWTLFEGDETHEFRFLSDLIELSLHGGIGVVTIYYIVLTQTLLF